jgi:hypothetical protein
MSQRSRPTSSSRSPLESLVYACLPSLAPPRQRPSSAIPSGRTSAASSSRPGSRIDGPTANDEREDQDRKARVKELMEFCEEILDSRLPSSAPLDIGTLPDTARRILASGKKGPGAGVEDRGLRFNSSWNKLEKGVRYITTQYRQTS